MLLNKISSIILASCVLLTPLFSQSAQDGWIDLFNGTDLEDWEGDPGIWSVQEGYIYGDGNTGYKSYLINRSHIFKDFILEVDFIPENGNSGVNYRCNDYDADENKPYEVSGYQADIGPMGDLYDIYSTSDAGNRYPAATGTACKSGVVRTDDWNTFRIVADGRNLSHEINGTLCIEFQDNDDQGFREEGFIALEFHDSNVKVKFRRLRVKLLNQPPVITSHPAEYTVTEGDSLSISVSAAGENLSYQWQRDGEDIQNAEGAVYTIPEASPGDSGAVFRCIVSNANGSDTSTAAILHVMGRILGVSEVLFNKKDITPVLALTPGGLLIGLPYPCGKENELPLLHQINGRLVFQGRIAEEAESVRDNHKPVLRTH